FSNPNFRKGETLKIYWGDNQISLIQFNKDSTLDSLDHIYNSKGVNVKILVEISNNYGCSVYTEHEFQAGYIVTFFNTTPYYCEPGLSCPFITIFDIKNKRNLNVNDVKGNLAWVLNNDDTSSSDMYPCFSLNKRGKNTINAVLKRPGGCNDTFSYEVFIQDLKANVETGSRNIFCNELKQFFDSSTYLHYPNEGIKSSNWDFGSGKFTNPVLNPFKSLSTSLPEIKVKHYITTSKGCVDTIEFTLTITGSHPYFTIKDTIACEYLDALFYNKSKDCGGYIWEFGDDSGTILPTNEKKDVRFLYNKPGRYLIKLNGYDSFYNPATKSTYFCNTVFPDPAFQKDSIRAVVVLPRLKSKIEAIDSICPNTIVDFTAKGNVKYEKNHWIFETDSQTLPQPDTIRKAFSRKGINRIKSVPIYNNGLYNTCFDTAYKDVYVFDVTADFDMKEDNSGVFVLFQNKSDPMDSYFDWDFGDPASGNKNKSNEVHPFHNYGFDTGTYTVCLVASSPIGCRDTTCKTVNKQGFAKLMVFNVFTPGNSDSKNDNYDVLIIGEQYYHLRIYDRWGVLVYESFEDDEITGTGNWNGKLFNTGPDCSDGTYYYIFDYQMNGSEKKETINGTVTLIR
ncbi:MAG TPA: gliding motility-associated C-terminal domain-containing protein, partial [Bacteroidia bacterium]